MTEEDVAKKKWNAQADQYNQWDELGKDEKDELIAKETTAKQPTMTLDEVLQEIARLQSVIARSEDDALESREALQKMYDLRDKMSELDNE
jgi:hypothetical protein